MARATILIVDDDAGILDALSAGLSERYQVFTARNGEEGLAVLARYPIVDLIVLDMRMPLLDGEGMLREGRSRGLRAPVILVSAHREGLHLARELGADAYLCKPFGIDELEDEIERLLADRSSPSGSAASDPSSGRRLPSRGPVTNSSGSSSPSA